MPAERRASRESRPASPRMEASSLLLAYQLLNDIGADGMVVVLLLIGCSHVGRQTGDRDITRSR
jgi:hypothetical protein